MNSSLSWSGGSKHSSKILPFQNQKRLRIAHQASITQGKLVKERGSDSGIALIVVLAMLVLVLGIVMAFFSMAIQQRQVSATSASNAEAGLLARTAANVVIDDVLQEINANSIEDPMANVTVGVRLPNLGWTSDFLLTY